MKLIELIFFEHYCPLHQLSLYNKVLERNFIYHVLYKWEHWQFEGHDIIIPKILYIAIIEQLLFIIKWVFHIVISFISIMEKNTPRMLFNWKHLEHNYVYNPSLVKYHDKIIPQNGNWIMLIVFLYKKLVFSHCYLFHYHDGKYVTHWNVFKRIHVNSNCVWRRIFKYNIHILSQTEFKCPCILRFNILIQLFWAKENQKAGIKENVINIVHYLRSITDTFS